jgi:D-alanyl-D-alanine carboxypeptidase
MMALLAAGLALAACSSNGGQSSSTTTTTAAPPASIATDGDLPGGTQAELEAALADVMSRFDVPGAVAAVTTPDGSWTAEAGVADLETGDPVSSEMVWPLRSLTKSITVTVLLQLAAEGLLDLDDTVDQYVEGVPDGGRMTLRQLADMTSGVGDYTQSEAFIEDFVGDPGRLFTLEELNEYGTALGAQFEPGSDRVYSNTAPNVLGVVIERVTGQPIADVIQSRILDPLGLVDTTYPTDDTDWSEPHAQGYQPGADGLEPSFNNFSAMGASGAMISTLADMTVWAEALGSGSLVSPEVHAERLVGSPLSEGPEYDQYAVGIGELDSWWGHTGEGLGFTALAMYDPESGSTVVVFMNISQAVGEDPEGEEEERHAPTVLMREFAPILAT